MKMEPDRYFEEKLQNTDFITEARDNQGTDVQESIFGDGFGGLSQSKAPKPEDIRITLECSLEEFYQGTIKEVSFNKNIVQHDAKSTISEPQAQMIEIKPGMSGDTELVFKKRGHQSPGHVDADLIVKFKEIPHDCYRRKGHDLILTQRLTLQQAFENVPCAFRTLDGRNMTIAIDGQIAPQTCKMIDEEGMPIENTDMKGNLIMVFDIEFPNQFQLETKQRMIAALQANAESQ